MDVELFVHGVPYGEDTWGNIGDDKTYLGSFYDRSTDAVKMVVQWRIARGRAYSYYNYLVYSNVVGNDGRDGAYFGMTLRFTECCTDVIGVFRVLDTAYHLYILGAVLVSDKRRVRYRVSKFADASASLTDMRDAVYGMLGRALTSSDFVRPTATVPQGNAGPQLFLYECGREAVISAITNYGRLTVSPYYPGGREKSLAQRYEARIKTEAERHATEADGLRSELASAKSRVAALEGSIAQREADMRRLSGELQNAKQTAKIAHMVQPIVAPINELAAAFRVLMPEADGGKAQVTPPAGRGKMPLVQLLRTVFSVLSFLLLLFIAASQFSRKPGDNAKANNDTNISATDVVEDAEEQAHRAFDLENSAVGGSTEAQTKKPKDTTDSDKDKGQTTADEQVTNGNKADESGKE